MRDLAKMLNVDYNSVTATFGEVVTAMLLTLPVTVASVEPLETIFWCMAAEPFLLKGMLPFKQSV
jgi:hypothetical protein